MPMEESQRSNPARILCRIEDITDGGSKEVTSCNDDPGLFLIRQGNNIYAYQNRCPHTGAPLNWEEDKFLSMDGTLIQCAVHGALFRISDGLCLWGPCVNQHLKTVNIALRDGVILLEDDTSECT